MNTLLLMVGLPRSGKSTRAREIASKIPGAAIVCPDAIRLELTGQRFVPQAEKMVWATTDLMIRSLFRGGTSFVVLDSTNTTSKYRAEWLNSGLWTCYAEQVSETISTCIARAIRSDQDDLIPVIEKMAREFEIPREVFPFSDHRIYGKGVV